MSTREDETTLQHKLATHSYAIVELPSYLQESLNKLHNVAEEFFLNIENNETSNTELFEQYRVLQKTCNGGIKLFGYTEPSLYKSLFRYYRNSNSMMKWPSLEMKTLIEECETDIRNYLESQFNNIAQDVFPREPGDSVTYKSLCNSNQTEGHSNNEDCCPFDIFFYPNKHQLKKICSSSSSEVLSSSSPSTLDSTSSSSSLPQKVQHELDEKNCEAHIDRGLMHIIVCKTSGLEVLDTATKQWISMKGDTSSNITSGVTKEAVEPVLKKSKRLNKVGNGLTHGVILINSMMQELTKKTDEFGQDGTNIDQLPACVHRVVGGESHRMSISFELRVPNETEEALANMKRRCWSRVEG